MIDTNSSVSSEENQKSKYNKETLGKLYTEAVAIDRKIFAEQRSNVLLYSGEHYSRPGSKFWNNVRDSRGMDSSTKIRIVKNHVQKICKTYMNNITNAAPGVMFAPRQEREIQHQKTAELNEAVWQFIQQSKDLDEKISNWCHDFIVQGEVALKIFWNPKLGRHIGYEQAVDKKTGEALWDQEPTKDAMGMDTPGVPKKGAAVFTGDIDYERWYSFNVLRDPACRNMNDSPILGYQKLIPLDEARELVGYDKDKMAFLTEGVTGSDYVVFDANDQRYVETKNQVLLVEWFVRPCSDYPEGYFFLATPEGDVLHEMPLPFGIYPIIYEGFDELTSTPRHYSIIKVARPYQSHLNFLASKHVEHAVTLGDDKIVTPMGAKIQQGSFLPGIRQVQASGDFKIMEGRTGEQFVQQMVPTISELYSVCNVAEDSEEKVAQLDAYTLLYRSMRDKKKFSKYAEKFERMLKKVANVSVDLYRNYADENMLIPAIGRAELVNISEFKNSDPMHYRVDVVPQTQDMESKLGKQLQINQLLQYAGSNLGKEDLGNLMRNAPYGNKEQMFTEWTMDYDNATNDVLALDRGEMPPARQFDNHEYQIKRLDLRMSKADFPLLHPFIQNLYAQKKQEHIMVMQQQAQEIQMAQAGLIPTHGPLGSADMYVTDPLSPQKVQRAKFPISALEWLAQALQRQGAFIGEVKKLSMGSQAELAQMTQPQQQAALMPQGNDQGAASASQQPYLSAQGGNQ